MYYCGESYLTYHLRCPERMTSGYCTPSDSEECSESESDYEEYEGDSPYRKEPSVLSQKRKADTAGTNNAEDIVRDLLRKKVSHTNIWKKMKNMGMTDSKEMMELLKACMKPETEPKTKNASTQLRTNSQWWSQSRVWRLAAMKDGYEPHDGRPCSNPNPKDSYCCRCGFLK